MGHELRRMIRDGAPHKWTGAMVHVAKEIADDARDPSRGLPEDGGLPWSRIPIKGHFDRQGRWRDGLTERCGMSERAISRALTDLADAGYEMREQIGTDKNGKPVFAAKGHAMRFRVPALPPRPVPVSPPSTAAFDSQSPPSTAGNKAQSPPSTAAPSPQEDLPLNKTFTSDANNSPYGAEVEVPPQATEPVDSEMSPAADRWRALAARQLAEARAKRGAS